MLQTERGGSQPPSRGRIDKLYYLLLQLPQLVASSSTTCCINYPYLLRQVVLLDASTTPICSNNYPYLFRLPLLVASIGPSSRQPWMKGSFIICLQLRFLGYMSAWSPLPCGWGTSRYPQRPRPFPFPSQRMYIYPRGNHTPSLRWITKHSRPFPSLPMHPPCRNSPPLHVRRVDQNSAMRLKASRMRGMDVA